MSYFTTSLDFTRFNIRCLSPDPRVFIVKHFLTAAECKGMMALGNERLKHSLVVEGETGDHVKHQGRVSEGCYFLADEHPLVIGIQKRIAQLTQVPTTNYEQLHMIRYQPGGFYQSHFDYFDPTTPGGLKHTQRAGQRIITVIMYLQEASEGGETHFPELNMSVRLTQGDALVFYNCKPNGTPDVNTLHAGESIRADQKTIMTCWIREESMFEEHSDSPRKYYHPPIHRTPVFTDDWRLWLAENILYGGSQESLIQILQSENFPYEQSYLEYLNARDSAYIQGAERVNSIRKNTLWLMDVYHQLECLSTNFAQIDTMPVPPFETFILDYYSAHRPVYLKEAVTHWPAFKDWTWESVKAEYGHVPILIQANRESDPMYEENKQAHQTHSTVGELIDFVLSNDSSNDQYLTAYNCDQIQEKFWYQAVEQVGDGYFNFEYPHGIFLWIGPTGTKTPFHYDRTNNFIAQIKGEKVLWLVSPNQSAKMRNYRQMFSEIQPDQLAESGIDYCEFLLKPGDAVFIPIGWWHAVESQSPSMTMTLTNFNAPNTF